MKCALTSFEPLHNILQKDLRVVIVDVVSAQTTISRTCVEARSNISPRTTELSTASTPPNCWLQNGGTFHPSFKKCFPQQPEQVQA